MDERQPKSEEPIDHTTIKNYVVAKKLGWEISGPFYTILPTPKAEYVEKCAEEVNALKYYLLKTVIIKDQFDKDHLARRNFEDQNPKIGTFFSEYSKLGGNMLNRSIICMENIIEEIAKKYPPIAEKLNTMARISEVRKELGKYTRSDFQDKVNFAKKLDIEVSLGLA